MGDLGKALYEIHVENCMRCAEPISVNWLYKWHELSEEARETWRETAQAFLKQMNRKG